MLHAYIKSVIKIRYLTKRQMQEFNPRWNHTDANTHKDNL